MKQLSNAYVGVEVSNATMREEDLIPTFMDFLEDVGLACDIQEEVAQLQEEVEKLEWEGEAGYGTYYKDQEQASWILNEDIWNLMNEIAPEFTYFGSHEGDGACYGFWTSMATINELEPMPELGDIRELANESLQRALEDIIKRLDKHSR